MLQQHTTSYYDNGGGLDLLTSPTKTLEDDSTSSLNADYSVTGGVGTALGSTIVNQVGSPGVPQPISGNPTILELFDYRKADGTEVQMICAGDTIYSDLNAPTARQTGLTADLIPDFEKIETQNSGEYALFVNGTDTNLKTSDGLSWTNLSIEQPTTPTTADFAAGALPAGDYYYYVSYGREIAGIIVQESELSDISTILTIAINRKIRVTIPVSTDSQVTCRILYRISPNSLGIAYRLAVISDNVTTTYDDNTAEDGTLEAEYDNQSAPLSPIVEQNDFGETLYVDASQKTDVYFSKAYLPWSVPTENLLIFDGPVLCLKRIFGAMIVGTDRSIWVINGALYDGAAPRRVSSKIGIINNKCAVGMASLYIMATDRKVYNFFPTDFSQDEIRLSNPISMKIDSQFSQISNDQLSKIKMEYFVKADQAKVMISAAIGGGQNQRILIMNEKQSILKNRPVWQVRSNIYGASIVQMTVNNTIDLYSGDYYGLIWKLEVQNQYGDGSEENGSVTSATATTLTDSTASWTVNEHVGKRVRIIEGIAVDEEGLVISNTDTELTIQTAFGTTPVADDAYTIGGYDSYHFTNWKSVNGSYDDMKQLHDFYSNLNTSQGSGGYTISVIFQFDFDQTEGNQEEAAITLTTTNTVWAAFIWGAAIWGARSVFQDRLRKYGRFRCMRIGIKNRKAGQPWQLNGFSLTTSDRGKLYRSA